MRFFRALESFIAWVAAFLFALTGFFITYEVIARYAFNAPTIWAAELSQLCLIWASLMAMASVLSVGRHIRVTAMIDLMPFRLRQFVEVIAMLLIIVFSVYVAWYGFEIFLDSFERGRTTGTMLDMPVWIAEAAVPAGFVLLIIAAINGLVNAIRGEVPEAAEVME